MRFRFIGRRSLPVVLWIIALGLIISAGANPKMRVEAFQGNAQINATLDDQLLTDQDSDTHADPGDTLRYTAEIAASGGDAGNVSLNVPLPDGVSLVPNSIKVSPVAFDDTAVVQQNSSVTIPVLDNDTNVDEGASWRASASVTIVTPPQRGTAVVNADNTIAYTNTDPSTSSDSLTYTVTDVDGLTSSAALVQITLRDQAPTVTSTSPSDGATNVSTTPTITVNFSESVDVLPGAFTLECPDGVNQAINVSPSLPATGTSFNISPVSSLGEGVTCVVTVVASDVSDTDTFDTPPDPDQMAADFIFSFTTDVAPEVSSTTPADNATQVASNTNITINFSEPVTFTGDWFTIDCTTSPDQTPSTIGAGGISGGPQNYTINPADFTPGETCTVTIHAAQVSDTDAGDPPDNMVADDVFSFTMDTAPTVLTVSPNDAASGVTTDSLITINFSESVVATPASFNLECPDGSSYLFTLSPSPATSYTLTPTGGLPDGVTCVVTVVANQISDVDTGDPPDQLDGNGDGITGDDYVFSFTTDAAPKVITTDPISDDAGLPTDKVITITFSEAVTVTASTFEVRCPASAPTAEAFTLGGSGSTYTLTPTTAWAQGVPCQVTVFANQVSDVDANDPPDQMLADYVFSFATDAAPTVASTDPSDNATGVPTDKVITITFSEAVTVTASTFEVRCPASAPTAEAFTLGGSGSTYTLTPVTAWLQAVPCQVTVFANQVSDVDSNDPPDQMLADDVFSFANDAAPEVTSTTPADNSNQVASNTNITINFSEPVTLTGDWFTIDCTTSADQTPTTIGAGGITSGPQNYIIDPADFVQGETCTVTVHAAQVSDLDANDPPDNMVADDVFSFTIDQAPAVSSTDPDNGASNVLEDKTITVNFSENVTVSAASFKLECPANTDVPFSLGGAGSSYTLDPITLLPLDTTCVVTVIAAQVSDTDSGDPPDNLAADYVFDFTIRPPDAAPFVSETDPADGAMNAASNKVITITFDEDVNVTASSFEVKCPAGAASGEGFTLGGSNDVYTLTPTSDLPVGVTCQVTVFANEVSDTDPFDPPDNMAEDYVFSFTVDTRPSVISTTAVNALDTITYPDSNVANDANLKVVFSEPVTVPQSGFELRCPSTNPTSNVAFSVGGSGTTTLTVDPTDPLPNGTDCKLTVLAAQVTDVDTGDPPDGLAADIEYTFTVDAAPTVSSANFALNSGVTINFSEAVTVSGDWFTINCSTSPAKTPTTIGAGGITGGPQNYVINPADFVLGESCTITIDHTLVSDQDIGDPPDLLEGNLPNGDYQYSFAIDAAPTVISTTPANNATLVAANTTIAITFSEAVTASVASFELECPAGASVAFTLSNNPAQTIYTLTPTNPLPGGTPCTVTVIATGISDTDLADPPDNLDGNGDGITGDNYVFTFVTRTVAIDDDYDGATNTRVAIGNMPLDTSSSGYSLFTNDQPNTGITSVQARATFPAGTVNRSVQGGTVTVNPITGTFTYTPPRGYSGADSFQYTITAPTGTSDPATVSLTVSTPVWFINRSANGGTGTYNGTYNTPYLIPSDFTSDNGTFPVGSNPDDGDIVFIYEGSYSGSPLALRNNQAVYGQDADTANDVMTDLVLATGQTAPDDPAVPLLPGGGTVNLGSNFGSGPSTVAINLRQNNSLRGFTVGNGKTGIVGTDFGTLTVSQVTLNGNGTMLDLIRGTLAASFDNLSSAHSQTIGISLDTVGGSLMVTGATSITNDRSIAIFINNAPAGTSYNFGSTTASTGDILNSSAIQVTGSSGTMTFGNTHVAQAFTGISLADNPATFNFGTLVIGDTQIQNTGFRSDNSGTINVTGATTITNAFLGNGIEILNQTSGHPVTFMGTVTVNGNSQGWGVSLGGNTQGNAAPITFGELDITPASHSKAFFALDNTGTITVTSGTINATADGGGSIFSSGVALNISTTSMTILTPLAIHFNSVTGSQIRIENASGTLAIDGGVLNGDHVGPTFQIGSQSLPTGDVATITYGGTITQNTDNWAVEIENTPGGSVTFGGTVTAGVFSNGVTIRSAETAITFTTLNLGTSSTRIQRQGLLSIHNGSSAATYNLGTLNIYTSDAGNGTGAGAAVQVIDFDGTLQSTAGIIDSSDRAALSMDGPAGQTNLAMTLTSVSGKQISLQDITGTLSIGGGTLTGNTSSAEFEVGTTTASSGGSATITYGGNVTNINGTQTVDIENTTGGSISFAGTVSADAASGGISITDAAGDVSFLSVEISDTVGCSSRMSGSAVVITRGSGAVNLGTINTCTSGISGLNNGGFATIKATDHGGALNSTAGTIDAANQTAIYIDGPAGLTPLGMSLTGVSASGDNNGIFLQDTSGSFTAFGGTIQNARKSAIVLTNVTNVSFNRMNIQNPSDNGVDGTQVTNFTFSNGTINHAGDAAGESAIAFKSSTTNPNVSGTVTITNNVITLPFDDGIDIENQNGTISDITISNNELTSIGPTAVGSAVDLLMAANFAQSTVGNITKGTIAGNVIYNFTQSGISITGGNAFGSGSFGSVGDPASATNLITISGNSMDGGPGGVGNVADHFVSATVTGSGQGNFVITGNGTLATPIQHIDGVGIQVSAVNTIVKTVISNNVLRLDNSGGAAGISASVNSGSNPSTMTATIDGNNVGQTDGPGIWSSSLGTGISRVTITNNTVAAPNTITAARPGILVWGGNSPTTSTNVCLNIRSNTTAGSTSGGSKSPGIELKRGSLGDLFGIVGLPGAPTGTPNVENYVNSINTSASGTFGVGGTFLSGQTIGFSACNSAPLHADGGQNVTSTPLDALTPAQLPPLAAEAAARWAAVGISSQQQAQLAALDITVADLPDGVLAYTYPDHIEIDATAAGYGWFVDATPADDAEFAATSGISERRADAASPAYGHMDLLTALMHEYGHVLGLGDQPTADQPIALMAETLSTGTRRVPLTQTGKLNTAFLKPASAPAAALSSFPVAIGTLPDGARVTVRFDVIVNDPFRAGTDAISAQGTVTYDDGVTTNVTAPTDDPDTSAPDDATMTPIDAQISLSLAKSDGGVSVVPGNSVTYTLTYANSGNQDASGVILTETVPDHTTVHPDSVAAGWVCVPDTSAGSTCTLDVGTVAGGSGDQTRQFIVQVPATVDDSVTQISNNASIDDDNTSGEDGFASASDTTPVIAAPSLAADKTVSDVNGGAVVPGDELEYSITLTNSGNRDAANVVFTDTIPANTSYVAGSLTVDGSPQTDAADGDGGQFSSNEVRVTLPVLSAPTGTVAITFRVTIANPYPETADLTLSNQGSVTADNADPVQTDDPNTPEDGDATAIRIVSGLTIAKAFEDTTLEVEHETRLTFTLTNPDGSPALTGLSFIDDLPNGLAYVVPVVTPQCAGDVTMTDADSLSFSGGQLAAGPSQCTISVLVTPTGSSFGVLTNETSLLTSAEAITSRDPATATIRVVEPDDNGGGASAPAVPIQNFLCANVATQTNNALVGQGGIGNVQSNGVIGDTYCHVIALDGRYITSPAEVGNLNLINLGIVQAVDVFGLLPGGISVTQFSSPVNICLRGTGSIYFISAIDNSIQLLAAAQNGGYLCVDVWTAGKLVLVGTANPNAPPPQNVPSQTSQSGAAVPVSQCQVTTTNAPLNLRAEPNTNSAVLAQLPFDLMLTATEYLPGAPGWYRVIYGDGQGWIREDFLNTLGSCPS